MKYVRKIIWLVIAVVFCASVIIGVGIIFAVKNVNILLESFKYSDWEQLTEGERAEASAEIADFKECILSKYRGTLIGFVDDNEIAACFDGTDFVFESCERDYPCTLNITLKERRETFIISTSQGFEVYDEHGEYLRLNEDSMNNLDNAPNIYVTGANAADMKEIALVSRYFAECFSALRTVVERIEVQTTLTRNMVFYFRCGIKVRIVDYTNLSELKMQQAYAKFVTLSGEEKLSGTIRVGVRENDGVITAERIPD